MASFGEYVVYDGLVYRVVAISEDAEPTYTLEPVRRSEQSLTKTITSSQKQTFIVPSGGENIASVSADDITVIGSRTATASALADGYVRVKFSVDGGSAIASQVIAKGAKATQPAVAPTKEHYTFDAWYSDADLTQVVNFGTLTFDDDTTLYAKWIIDTFTVTYNSNGGSSVASEIVDYGDKATKPVVDPNRVGYLFDAWYTDDTSFENAFDFETPIVANITLYANWIEAVTVTFDSGEGSSPVEAQVIVKGGKATEPEPPTLEDYTFAGWFYDELTLTNEVNFLEDVFGADDTLYAKWTPAG